jgi:hypothetical protein
MCVSVFLLYWCKGTQILTLYWCKGTHTDTDKAAQTAELLASVTRAAEAATQQQAQVATEAESKTKNSRELLLCCCCIFFFQQHLEVEESLLATLLR